MSPEEILAQHGRFLEPLPRDRAMHGRPNGAYRSGTGDSRTSGNGGAARDIGQIGQIGQRESADDNQWPEPDRRLVEDDRTPAPTLDDNAQPDGWGEWIAREAAARDCPPDYLTGGLIGSASAWIGNSRHVAANQTWSEPPHLWLSRLCRVDQRLLG
jgi:hypothetical protein